MNKRRVVVTGLGLVTALGSDPELVWQKVLRGKSGVCVFTHLQVDRLRTRIAAVVNDFFPDPYVTKKEQRQFDLFIQYGIVAAMNALKDANFSIDEDNATRVGIAIGSGIGGLTTIEANHSIALNKGVNRILPSFIPGTIVNMLPGLISIKIGARGPNFSVVSACATSNHNIVCAKNLITCGDADVMIVGGSEKASTLLGIGGFSAMRAMSTRNDQPKKASRPWDKDRDGFVLGDGAAILVLEEYEHAKLRDASIYAELVGSGMSSDAYHITSPKADGSTLAMKLACEKAGIVPEEIQYINAHATSTQAGDIAEVAAIKQVFGNHAARLAVSSTKSMTGHLLGAAGALESIFSILALRDQIIPPTINLDHPDEGCDLDFVPHKAQRRELSHVLTNSFGFGGTNVSLIFKRI